ncbi:MAG: metallophosphoesterase [bacterium]
MRKTLKLILVILFVSCCAGAAQELPRHPNREEIKKLDESGCDDGFSFAVMGDSHVSRNKFEKIIGLVDEMKPDFAFTVGDFTNDGLPEEYEIFVGQITRAGVPWFTAPGNHEYRTPEGRTSTKGRKRYEKIFGNADFFFDHCGWRFVGLDVVAFDMLTNSQIKKLKEIFDGYEGRAAVFMHYPPAPIENWEEGFWTTNAERFMEILESNKVRYFFSGHIHVYDTLDIGPTTYIVTGGAGESQDTRRTPDTLNSPDAGAFHHFVLVEAKEDKAVHKVVRPDTKTDDSDSMNE